MCRILVVEDSPTQAQALAFILMEEGFEVVIALDGERGFDLFSASDFHLVITDVVMPGISGHELCRQIKSHPVKGRVPVLLLTTLNDPLDILQGIECGADNYLTKPYQADALLGRIDYLFANRERQAEGRLKLGLEVEFLGKKLAVTSDRGQILDLLISTCEDVVRANRELRASQTKLAAVQAEVERHNAQLVRARDELEDRVRERTAELAKANELLQREREFLKAVLENAQDGIMACDVAGALTFFNRAARDFHGQPEHTRTAEDWAHPYDLYGPDGKTLLAKEDAPLLRALRGEQVRDVEVVVSAKAGVARTLWASGQAILGPGGETSGAVVVLHDVTDRNRLEQQLRQAQKMEAVGRLAGGVAHDFNNLLTIIGGCSELLLSGRVQGDSSRGLVEEIKKAGDRAAGLTRQLLAFSRQQVIAPQVLDLSTVVADVGKMLRRVIGEDIELMTVPNPTLGLVKADLGQVEQILMNLAVNARDAMPKGGRLAIETANVEFDVAYARLHPEVRQGSYVRMEVSDTGCGMDALTRARIFEPFFTTKGTGTGLGLATVYGIVKQSGGYVYVQSEVGGGTTFQVLLPRVEAPCAMGRLPAAIPSGLGRRETLLLVEDEPAVRSLARNGLQMGGYTVLEASGSSEALRISEQHQGPIHLLLTDVVMPGRGGGELANRLASTRQDMKILFLSGYTDDAVVRHGVLEAESAFLQKPFTLEALARKVREVLDKEKRGANCQAHSGRVPALSP